MISPHLPPNMIALARRAVRHPDTAPAQVKEAATLLCHSPDPADRLIGRQLSRDLSTPRPDMAQMQPEDAPQRLEPGGTLGWLSVCALLILAAAALTTVFALLLAPQPFLSFITLGGFHGR